MDAVLFLLNQGVNQARITWIMPSDSWMLERDQLWIGQPPPPPLMTEGADLERVARDAGDDPARQAFGQMETMGALLRYLRLHIDMRFLHANSIVSAAHVLPPKACMRVVALAIALYS